MNYMPRPEFPPSNDASEPDEATFRLQDLVAIFVRRARLIVGAFVVIAATCLAALLMQAPRYSATATIMINPGQERILNADQSLSATTPTSPVVDSELEVLRSPKLARQVVDALKLTADAHWNPALQPASPWSRLTATLGNAFLSGAKKSSERNGGDGTERAVTSRLMEAVTVKRRALSYVADITVEAGDPEQAALIANTFVQLYLNSVIEARSQTGARATGWLGQRLDQLEKDLRAKESAAEAFRAQTGLLVRDGDSLTETQIKEVQTSVLSARADLAEREARFQQVQRLIDAGGSADTIASVLTSSTIRDLRAQEADLARRQSEYESTLGDLHPLVVNGRAELANVRSQIKSEIERIAQNLRNEAEVARARLRTLEGSLSAARGEMEGTNSSEVRLDQLEREAAAARTVYENFLQRYHEIAGQGQIAAAEVRVVSQAIVPRAPAWPKPQIALFVSLAAGLLGALLLALGAEALNDSLLSAADVEARIGVPALTSVPIVSTAALRLLAPTERHPSGFLVEKPMSPYAEAFRVLRSSIQFASIDRQTRVVAVTSAMPDEGKTTCAFSLARIAALSGQSVIVVDCDLRRRSLNTLLDIEPAQGLLQVLTGEQDWTKVTGQDDCTSVHVLPVAAASFTPRDVFGTQAMERLLDNLRAAYDLVILDCPPVWAVADTRIIATQADTVLMVARWNKTSVRAIAGAVKHLSPSGANVLGVVLNRVNPRAPGRSGYSDPTYYAYASKGYYAS